MSEQDNRFFGDFLPGRRGEILDAALQVFGESGYEAGTMRNIAQRVGFTEPALYRHYASKEALLVDLVSAAGEHLTSTAARQLTARPDSEIPAAVLALLQERRGLLRVNFGLVRTLLAATAHNTPARDALRTTMFLPMQDNLLKLITRMDAVLGIERPREAVAAAARATMSLLVGHLLTSELLEADGGDEELVATLMAVMGWRNAL